MKASKILVVDDDEDLLLILADRLKHDGHIVTTTSAAKETLALIDRENPDLVLLDVMLGDDNGLDVLDEIKKKDPRLSVIIMTASTQPQIAIEAMKRGAYDYVTKPLKIEELQILVKKVIDAGRFMMESVVCQTQEFHAGAHVSIVGRSPGMLEVYKTIGKVADSNVTVLIQGESGTGKELVAKAIYQNSSRKNHPFLEVNCAAIPETLLESELFGHEKGSFTGATSKRIGKFQQCDKGTIFLDEVGDMPLTTQTKILRVLQEQTFQPVGSESTVKVDVRVIASTNKDLWKAMENKEFREDLYYRLKVVTIEMPPLRHRTEDIPLLAEYFVSRFNAEFDRNIKKVSPEVMERLTSYSWPGNVRELENALQTAVVMSQRDVLLLENFPFLSDKQITPSSQIVGESSRKTQYESVFKNALALILNDPSAPQDADLYKNIVAGFEKILIETVLEKTDGNQVRSAQMLNMSRNTLRQRMREYGLLGS